MQLPLRERKRLAAMRRIQTVALALFESDGFDAVTVERIAEVAEVSASSIYRWFGTKEALVIWDEYDPQAVAAIEEAMTTAPGPITALRQVVDAVVQRAFEGDLDRVQRRMRLAMTTPSIEAASVLQTYEMAGLITAVLRANLDEDADPLDVQVLAHAFVGGLLGALRYWHESGYTAELDDLVERSIRVVERGTELR